MNVFFGLNLVDYLVVGFFVRIFERPKHVLFL